MTDLGTRTPVRVPERLRSYSRVHLAQWAIAIGAVVLHAWVTAQGYFHNDDFLYLTWSQEPLGDFLLRIYNNHLMPLEYLAVWVGQLVAPFSWWAAASFLVGCWAVILVGCVLLMRRAFGDSLWTLAAIAVIGLGPLPATVSVWWASGLQFLPWTACLVWMLYFAVRDAQDPGRWWWLACLAVYLVNLGFWQKGLFAVPVVLWLAWRYWPGTGRWGLRNLGKRWILPISLVVVSLAYLPIFLSVQSSAVLPAKPTVGNVFEMTWVMLADVTLPSFLGLPWGSFGKDIDAHIDPNWPWWGSLIVLQLAVALVVWSVTRWRSAWNAWALAAGYAALTVGIFAWGRFDRYGVTLAYDPRYVEDLYVVLGLILPFAFARPIKSPLPDPEPMDWERAFRRPIVLVPLAIVLLNALVLPTISVGLLWQQYPGRQFVESVKAAILANPTRPFVDRKLPGVIMMDFFLEDRNLSNVFSALRRPINWNGAGERILAFDESGLAFEPGIIATAASLPGPSGVCGYQVRSRPTGIPLNRSVFEWIWIGRMDYLASDAGLATLTMDTEIIDLPLEEGANSVSFVIVGAGQTITITPPPDVTVCVDKVVIGNVDYEARS